MFSKWFAMLALLALLVVGMVGASCVSGDDDDDDDSAADDDATDDDSGDDDVSGGAVDSDNGLFSGNFTPDPDPPVAGDNELAIELFDAEGTPLAGATVEATPFMPSMGHGSDEDPVVEELGDGAYLATNIVYTMPGPWDLTIVVTTADAEDMFVLAYDVE